MEKHDKPDANSKSYRSILKSTSLIGGASVLNILIGIVRTKFVAVLLGPSGVGLLGMYGQIVALVDTMTGMGLGNSAVRQVAEAAGSDDEARIARTVITVRRMAWLTGFLGLLVMVVFCVRLSRYTFGNSDHARSIAWLGIALLLGAIARGQVSIINGVRHIGDLAKTSVISAVNGTLISIPCFYFWGERGIVAGLILCSLASLATTWWFVRRVRIIALELPWRACSKEARKVLSMGMSFMSAGLAGAAAGYLIRVLLLQRFDIDDVGIYQAAFNLSGVLVGFVLGAMGADYFPRLTAVANDNDKVYRMINEQSEISILLALPGLAAMMIFAPQIIRIFYSSSFDAAVPILRWCIFGILGRVLSWPLGFVILAKGNGRLVLVTEVLGGAFHVAAAYIFVLFFGLEGAGIAFMASYIFYSSLMFVLIRRLIGRVWTESTIKSMFFAPAIMILLMVNCTFANNPLFAWTVSIATLGAVMGFCLRQLLRRSEFSMDLLRFKKG